jgi:uncharacterized membrane protein YdjX (TVP38/TMEM64 family)
VSDQQAETADDPEAPGGLSIGKVVLGIAALAALIVLGSYAGGYVEPFRDWIDGLGAAGPIVFALVYAVSVVAFVPASALTIAGGLAFGVVEGSIIVFLAATLGATVSFLIARYVAREAIESRTADNPRFAAIDRAIESQGRRIVLLLRLSPVFPFVLLNYLLGLTNVRLTDYVVASIGMIPGTVLYVYIGSLSGDVAAASDGGAESGKTALLVIGFVATLVVTILITRIAKRALDEAAGDLPSTKEA